MPAELHYHLDPSVPLSIGQDVFEVLIHNWGTLRGDGYPILYRFDGTPIRAASIPHSPLAVTIGARSTVDRVFVSWNVPLESGIARDTMRVLSVDSPLLTAQPTKRGKLAPTDVPAPGFNFLPDYAVHQGLLWFFADWPIYTLPVPQTIAGPPDGITSTAIPETYLKADGTEAPIEDGTGLVTGFDMPILHLVFHYKNIPTPTRRAPYQNFSRWEVWGQDFDPGIEFLFKAWPIFGRRRVVIQAASTDPGVAFRVACLRNTNPDMRMQETTEGLKTSTAPMQSHKFTLCDPCADYVLLYATYQSQNVPRDRDTWATITAYD